MQFFLARAWCSVGFWKEEEVEEGKRKKKKKEEDSCFGLNTIFNIYSFYYDL